MLSRFALGTLLLATTGCAGVDIYRTADLKGSKTGIPFYTPKPFILVSRTGAKDKPTDISVVYLPDLTTTYYAKPKSGFGSAKMNMSFSNGVMTTFGQETDPKITELVTALAGVPGALAAEDKIKAEAKKLLAEAGALEEQSSDLGKVASDIKGVSDDLDNLKSGAGYGTVFTTTDQRTIDQVLASLRTLETDLVAPGAEAQRKVLTDRIEVASKNLNRLKSPDSFPTQTPDSTLWTQLQSIQADLSKVLSEAVPKPPEPPSIELYELIYGPYGAELKEVNIDRLAATP